eukprot:8224905-Pyramimonas_sp.AAC.1
MADQSNEERGYTSTGRTKHVFHRLTTACPTHRSRQPGPYNNITSFYGSSCADNGKGALNTPELSPETQHPFHFI